MLKSHGVSSTVLLKILPITAGLNPGKTPRKQFPGALELLNLGLGFFESIDIGAMVWQVSELSAR